MRLRTKEPTISLGVGAVFSELILALLIVLAAFYFLFVLWCAFLKWRKEKMISALLIAFIIPAMHLAYGLAQWIELFRPGRDLSIKKN